MRTLCLPWVPSFSCMIRLLARPLSPLSVSWTNGTQEDGERETICCREVGGEGDGVDLSHKCDALIDPVDSKNCSPIGYFSIYTI